MKKQFVLILCILYHLARVHGQVHDYRLWTQQDGLAGTEIISVARDAFGQMWFSGNSGGVSYYDGKKINRLTDTSTQSLLGFLMEIVTTDGDSTIVLHHYEKGISFVRNGKIRNYRIQEYPILRGAALPNSGFVDGRIWGINTAGIVFQYDSKKDNFIEIGRVPVEKGSLLGEFSYHAPSIKMVFDGDRKSVV